MLNLIITTTCFFLLLRSLLAVSPSAYMAYAYTCSASSSVSVNTAVTITDSTFEALPGCRFISTNAVTVNDMTEVLKLMVATSAGARSLRTIVVDRTRFENVIFSIDSSNLNLVTGSDRLIPLEVTIANSEFTWQRNKWVRSFIITGKALPKGSTINLNNNTFVGKGEYTTGNGRFGFIDLAVPSFEPSTLLLIANNTFRLTFGGYAGMILTVLSFSITDFAASRTFSIADESLIQFVGNSAGILPYYSPGYSSTNVIVAYVLNLVPINVTGSGRFEMIDSDFESYFTPLAGGFTSYSIQGLYLALPLSIANGGAVLFRNISISCTSAYCSVFRTEASVTVTNRSSLVLDQCGIFANYTVNSALWAVLFSMFSSDIMTVSGESFVIIQGGKGLWRNSDPIYLLGISLVLAAASFHGLDQILFEGSSAFRIVNNTFSLEGETPLVPTDSLAVLFIRVLIFETIPVLAVTDMSMITMENNVLMIKQRREQQALLRGSGISSAGLALYGTSVVLDRGIVQCSNLTISVKTEGFPLVKIYGLDGVVGVSVLLQNRSLLSFIGTNITVDTTAIGDYFNVSRPLTMQNCYMFNLNQSSLVLEGNSSAIISENFLYLQAYGIGQIILVLLSSTLLRLGYTNGSLYDASAFVIYNNNASLEVGSTVESSTEHETQNLWVLAFSKSPLKMGTSSTITVSQNSMSGDLIRDGSELRTANIPFQNVSWPFRVGALYSFWMTGVSCELSPYSRISVTDNTFEIKEYVSTAMAWVISFLFWRVMYPPTATSQELRSASDDTRYPIPFVVSGNQIYLNESLAIEFGTVSSYIQIYSSTRLLGPLFAACRNSINTIPQAIFYNGWTSPPMRMMVPEGAGCSTTTPTIDHTSTHSLTDSVTPLSKSATTHLITTSESASVSSTKTMHLSSLSVTVAQIHAFTASKDIQHTNTHQKSFSASASSSCADLSGFRASDACSVFRPLPAPWLPSSSATVVLHANSSCGAITVPFSTWGGRTEAAHTLAFVAADQRAPLRKASNPAVAGTDLITAGAQRLESVKVLLGNTTRTVLAGVVTLTYLGNPTLNRLQYRLDIGSWASPCLGDAPGVFEVTLLGSERLVPVGVAEAVSVGGGVVSAGGGLTGTPTAVAQLSVASSLRKMSRCSAMALEAEGDESYAAYTGGVLNPFGLAVGGSGGGRRYLRGALVTSAAYFACLSGLMLAYAAASARIVRSAAQPPLLAGYPAALVAVVAFAMDGAVGAGTVLGVQGSGWGDALLGWAAVLLCAVFVLGIVNVTVRQLPKALRCEEVPPSKSEEEDKGVWRLRWRWLTAPTHEWRAGKRSAAAWVARHESYIADSRLAWYCGQEQGTALLVCLLGSLPLGDLPFCIARGLACVVLLGAQTCVMVVLRPPVHRWRWLLLSLVLVLQTLMAGLSVANAPLQEPTLELGMDLLSSLVFLLVLVSYIGDMLPVLMEARRTAGEVLRRRCQARHAGSSRNLTFQLQALDDILEDDLLDDILNNSFELRLL